MSSNERIIDEIESLSLYYDNYNDNDNNSNKKMSNNNNNNNNNNNIISKIYRKISSLPSIAVIFSFLLITVFLLLKSEYKISIFKNNNNQNFKVDYSI